MTTMFLGNMDFVFLIYGLAFFLLATVSFSMSQVRGQCVSWAWLGLFAVFHGLSDWIEMLVPAVGVHSVLVFLRVLFLVLSFLFLFEFGRRNVVWSGGHRVGLWAYLPPLLLLAGVEWRFGCEAALEATRMLLAFPGGLLAAMVLWKWGTPPPGKKRYYRHRIAPLAMVVYAVLSGLVVPPTAFNVTGVIPVDVFQSVTGLPVELFRCAVACAIALVIWYEHFVWRANHFSSPAMKWIVRVELLATALVVVVLMGGFIAVNRVQALAEREIRDELTGLSRLTVAAINADCVKYITADASDRTDAMSDKFVGRWQRIVDSSKDVHNLYMLRRDSGQWRFVVNLASSQYRADRARVKPGTVYLNAPRGITQVYMRGATLITTPSPDRPGRYVSVYAPIPNPGTGVVEGVLGLDLLASDIERNLLQERLPPLLSTALVALLMIMFIVFWLQLREDAELKHVSMARAQHQQEVLWKLAKSTAFTDGSVFMAWREITEAAGPVMGVDRVEVLTSVPHKGDFLCEDSYDVARGHHGAGAVYPREKAGPLMEVCDDGRAVAVDDLASDARFKGLKANGVSLPGRAMILAPFTVPGTSQGLMIFAQETGVRKWQNDEVRFASEVAGLVLNGLINRERCRAERALGKAHEELEERVRTRTEELSRRNRQLNLEIEERKRLEQEREKLEVQVRQTQKLECLGVMAGGIAHDFNNILMAILGNAELAKFETDPSSPVYGYVQDIEKAATRAATLSRQMLAYSGRGNSQIQPLDLNVLVREIVGMLEVSVSKKVTFIYNLEESLKTLDGDSAQIGQIVMNLVINAAEAIGEQEGVITLQTGTIWCDSGMLVSTWTNEQLPEGEYVYLDVQDTGAGMDHKTLSRIFDPFFTTKFTGRGLGLAAVLGIVRSHHGLIDVCSEEGHGTTFRVLFPVGKMSCQESHPPHEKVGISACGGAVLLVDDEEAVRSLGRKFIGRMGLEPIVAADGLDAIVKFREHRDDIRCVLLDLMMPKYDGHETLEELRKVDPGVEVIICSGYTQEDVAARYADWKVAGFIEKPYRYEALKAKLDEVLRRNVGNEGGTPTGGETS